MSAFDTISFPVTDAHGCVALGAELLRVGQAAGKLPPLVKKALDGVATTHAALVDAVGHWTATTPPEQRGRAVAADRVMDASWRAMHAWLQAWASLPTELGQEPAAQAQAVLGDLFSEGLKFLQAPHRVEWSESAARIQRLAEMGRGTVIAQLGGERFLEAVRKAHAAYGDALGITADRPETPAPVAVRGPRDDFRVAVKRYAAKVMGQVDEDDPVSVKLAETLLAPLSR
jgi:hypothetical protein